MSAGLTEADIENLAIDWFRSLGCDPEGKAGMKQAPGCLDASKHRIQKFDIAE